MPFFMDNPPLVNFNNTHVGSLKAVCLFARKKIQNLKVELAVHAS